MTARAAAGPVETAQSPGAVLKTLEARAVTLDGGLWVRRQSVNREAALPHGLRMMETAGNLDNLRIAAGRKTGRFRGRPFMDSDVTSGWRPRRSRSPARRATSCARAAGP